MIKHERHCTMNPERECGMCEMANNEQQSIITLFGALDSGGLDKLREISGNCPICIFATLRQTKKFNGRELWQYDFDLKDEMKRLFDKIHDEDYRRELNSYVPY